MKLRDYLDSQKLPVKSFAEVVGVSRQTLHLYLTDERFPRRAVLARIHEASDGLVTANDFAGVADPTDLAPAQEAAA